ncbi:MAG TPA: response regulator [Terriglobales bacterium]|nr:response regulator [Terriglobales bacterium]
MQLLPPSKILLVDDKLPNILALESVLDGPEYVLIRAQSGDEALLKLKQNPDIAIVLLDVQMPRMDGYEVARRIKELPHGHDLPIIFITAIFAEDPFVKKGYEAGAVDYFSKPFDPAILKFKVRIYTSFRQRTALLQDRLRQVQESEEILRAGRKLNDILESLKVGVIIADTAGRICQVNDQVLRLWNSVEQYQNDSYGEFIRWWEGDGHNLKAPDSPLMRAVNTGRATHNESVAIVALDGMTKNVYASASPLRSLQGEIVGAVLVLQDFSEHKKIEADLESRIVRLVSAGVELEQSSQ